MKFKTLNENFLSGKIEKPDFIQSAYTNFHQTLFEYVSHLRNTDIREISITPEGVVFTVRSTGVKIFCQPGDHRSPPVETFNFADFEPKESRMMRKLFEGGKTFYDIGANIGWHSINLAAAFRDAVFYCFEPIPKTYQELLTNIRLNTFDNINTFNLALSDSDGLQSYYVYEACSGNASAVNLTGRDDVQAIECHQTTLDNFYKGQSLPSPDFIKCDVEGAELLVFKGARKTLIADTPIIMTEILRKWSAKYNYNPNEIFTFLFHLGYLAFTTDGYQLFPFHEMTESTIETNFFFLHPLLHGEKIRRHVAP